MSEVNEKIIEIISACRSCVYCGKGNFYPDKDFGSKIMFAENSEKLMLSYIRMALSRFDGVYVKDITYVPRDNLITMDVIINSEERQVYVVI